MKFHKQLYKVKKFFVLIANLLFFVQVSSQLPNTLPKNEFGLQVIDNQLLYAKSVILDSTKKMVLLQNYLSQYKVIWYYATANNFTKQKLYNNPLLIVRNATAIALQAVETDLAKNNLGLIFYDAYRPYSVTKKMWAIVPDEKYAANPAYGSGHNRGAAVDVGLYNLQTGEIVEMPTAFDDFTEKAHHNYMNASAIAIKNRNMLKLTMEKHGFVSLATEWWHYSLPNAAKRFEILDINFKKLKRWIK
jgi:zinc D-Ala-D-Ala dipeptidase